MVAGLGGTPEGSCPSLLFPLGSAGISFSQGALPGLDGFDSGSPYLSAVLLSEKKGRQVVFLGVWLFRGRDPGCAEGL